MGFNIDQADELRLQHCLTRLACEGKLEFSGEYGNEITTFIPFVAWLHRHGHLDGRCIVTYAGMRPYYFFLDDDQFKAKREPRRWLRQKERYWPSNTTYSAKASPWHVYSDYRKYYAASGPCFERPVIFIQNKFAIEWGVGPINYIPLNGLKDFLELTAGHFDVVYSRPHSLPESAGYSKDHNVMLSYPDIAVLDEFPHVHHFERLCADGNADYNRTKLEILAKSHLFVAVQGGGAHILACFGNSLMLLLDCEENMRVRKEYPHAYQHGPYKYLAECPPTLMVARNYGDFNAALKALGRARFVNSNLLLPAEVSPFLRSLEM